MSKPLTSVLIMGVSGSGKTTIGERLAGILGYKFLDADDFHPEANREKLAHGQALTDEDRIPWLERVAHSCKVYREKGEGVVLACSALKESYRQILSYGLGAPLIVHLSGESQLIASRLQARQGHFSSPLILQSQIETLEAPPLALTISIEKNIDEIVADIIRVLKKTKD